MELFSCEILQNCSPNERLLIWIYKMWNTSKYVIFDTSLYQKIYVNSIDSLNRISSIHKKLNTINNESICTCWNNRWYPGCSKIICIHCFALFMILYILSKTLFKVLCRSFSRVMNLIGVKVRFLFVSLEINCWKWH